MEPNLTQEQQEDIQARQREFMERYTALVEELQMDFMQYPSYVPSGPGLWSTLMSAELKDKKYLAPLSPIQPT